MLRQAASLFFIPQRKISACNWSKSHHVTLTNMQCCPRWQHWHFNFAHAGNAEWWPTLKSWQLICSNDFCLNLLIWFWGITKQIVTDVIKHTLASRQHFTKLWQKNFNDDLDANHYLYSVSATIFTLDELTAVKFDFLRSTALWRQRSQASLNADWVVETWNLRLMLKISCTRCPGLPSVISEPFTLEMRIAGENRKNTINTYFGVQGHSTSLLLVPIASACTTSYYWLTVTLALSRIVSEIGLRQLIG